MDVLSEINLIISVCYICNSMIVVHKKIFKTFFGVMYLYEYKTVNMQMLQYMLAL